MVNDLAHLAWLSLMVRAGLGGVTFCVTENGDIGVFVGENEPSLGSDNTAEDALAEAHRNWHQGGLPEQRTICRCAQLDLDGENINAY